MLHEGNSAKGPGYYIITNGPYMPGSSLLEPDADLSTKVEQAEAPDSTLPLKQINAAASNAIYFPLLPNTVRTILLHPGRPEDPIVCSLVQPTIIKDNAQALSYVWGSHENPACIFLNGIKFHITRNLEAALLRIRSTEYAQELWIDALCINQFDQAERNEQVRRMHQVYAQVSSVLAWLGNANPLLEHATYFISMAEETFNSLAQDREEIEETSVSSLRGLLAKTLDELNDMEVKTIACSLSELYRNEYWDRLWIVQEIALAKRVIVICGEYEAVTLPALIDLGAVLDAKIHQSISSFSKESYNFTLMLSALALTGPNSVTLAPIPDMPWTNTYSNNLIHLALTKRCKDPRDKIFGCYNLLEPELQEKILVDYACGPREVILSALQTIIITTQRLDIVTWRKPKRDHSSTNDFESTLPHWAPSLNIDLRDTSCELAGNFDSGHESLGTIHFSPCSEILQTKGVRLGYVRDTFMPPAVWDQNFLNELWDTSNGLHPFLVLSYIRDCIKEVEQTYGGPMDRAKLAHTITQGNFEKLDLNLLLGFTSLSTEDANEYMALLPPQALSILEAACRVIFPRAFFLMIPADAETYVEEEEYIGPDMGLGTHDIEPKDLVCVLLGCKVPVVLRPEGGEYRVICDAYVHGYMHGEALTAFQDRKEELEEFLLS